MDLQSDALPPELSGHTYIHTYIHTLMLILSRAPAGVISWPYVLQQPTVQFVTTLQSVLNVVHTFSTLFFFHLSLFMCFN